jgi:hypothetical protein
MGAKKAIPEAGEAGGGKNLPICFAVIYNLITFAAP